MFENTEKVPEWAKTMIEGLLEANTSLAAVVKDLSERQTKLEAKFDGKEPEKTKPTKEATEEELDAVSAKLNF